MSDKELRILEREALQNPEAERGLQRLRIRSGVLKRVWALQYGKDSVGLDSALVGLFTTRQACVDHIKKHEKNFRPGRHRSHDYKKYDENFNQWTNGYRALIIRQVPLHEESAEEWFAA
jgi:hypothetical protein